jgi:hypothetical protein
VCGISEAKVVMAKLLNWLERKFTMGLWSRRSYVTDGRNNITDISIYSVYLLFFISSAVVL